MKIVAVLVFVVACCVALPPIPDSKIATIVQQDYNKEGLGNYKFKVVFYNLLKESKTFTKDCNSYSSSTFRRPKLLTAMSIFTHFTGELKNVTEPPYHLSYQTSDGMSREENAELKNPGTDNEALVVRGSYSYVGTDGITYTINYIADENGYRPTGSHIPKNTIAQ